MIKNIINELNKENGSNYKMGVLKKHKDNKQLQRVLKMCYDKVAFTYGVTMKNVSDFEPDTGDSIDLEFALDQLENLLSTRRVTGNSALKMVSTLLHNLTEDDASIIEGIIKRDLRINMGRSNINKVFKGLITKPIYMRCDTYSKKTAKNINFTNAAIVQKKADGTYREFSSIEANTNVVSRSGEQYDYFEFEKAISVIDGYLHGELTVFLDAKLLSKILPDLEKLDKKNGTTNAIDITREYTKHAEAGKEYILPRSIGNGLINSSDVPYDNLILDVWDLITLEDYQLAGLKDKKNLPKEKYATRFTNLKDAVDKINHPRIRVIEYEIVDTVGKALQFASKQMSDGFEGAILKDLDMLFKDGTSKQQLKLKLEIDLEVRCTGFTEGREGTKREATFGAITFENDEGTIKGQCSGFSDSLLEDFNSRRDELIGRVFTVQFNDLTKARGNDYHALSHPRFIEFRDDKDETDTLEKAFELRTMAMELS